MPELTKKQAYNKAYREKHRDQLIAYGKEYRKENKDDLKAKDRARRDDKRKAQELSYNEANRDKRKAYAKQYRKDNPALIAEANIRTRAAKMQRTPEWSNQKLNRMFYVQAICMRKVYGIQYDVDHIIPLRGKSVSGLHVHNNLRVITSRENGLKGNAYA